MVCNGDSQGDSRVIARVIELPDRNHPGWWAGEVGGGGGDIVMSITYLVL